MLANQPTDTATKGETRNTGLRDDAAGDCKTEDMGFAVEITKGCTALYAHGPICRIHVDGTHSGQIYDDTVIAKCAAAHIVTATTNCRQQIIRASEVESSNDISDACAASNEPRMFVDACIPDLAGLVVARVRRLKKLTVECRFERLNVHRRHKWGPFYRIRLPECRLAPAASETQPQHRLRIATFSSGV